MDRLSIGFGIDGYGRDAKIATRAYYAHRDFTTIGNENFPKHRSL
jgi:hypothetical protein